MFSQQALADSHDLIGRVLFEQGDLSDALESYKAAQTIKERLAEAGPSNTRWQSLSVSHSQIGDVLVRQGDLSNALESYKAAQTIIERLAKADPSNVGRQFNLSVSYGKIGSVLWASGDRVGALANYHKAQAVAETQAALVEAQEVKSKGKPGSATARALGGSVAWYALFDRNFTRALAATERARMLAPEQIQPDTNRAHALLFLNRTREAANLYLVHKGKMVSGKLWENVIANDFDELRKGGLGKPQMVKIKSLLGATRR
jgi:predicted negative regulator of RcsB-dependent stress response